MTILGLRTGTAAIAAAAAATLALGAPASADVTVSPTQAVQGDAGRLTFRITNDSPKASLVRIELQLPADNPIAEVYPLSVPLWAPRITTRPLDGSLPGLHGGRVTDTTSAIIWTPAPGGALKPGKAVDLSIALGPLPQTPTLNLTVLRTHSDGTVTRSTGRPGQPTAEQLRVTLSPPTGPTGPVGGHGHATGPQGAPAAPAAGEPTAPAPEAASSTWWTVAGWLCAGLIACYALGLARRGRRTDPAATPAGADAAAAQRPRESRPLAAAAAGTPVRPAEMGSRWTYRERG